MAMAAPHQLSMFRVDSSFFTYLNSLSPMLRFNPDPVSIRSLQSQRAIAKSSISRVSFTPKALALTHQPSLLKEITLLCESKKLVQASTLLQECLKDSIFSSSDRAAAVAAVLQACGHQADIEIGRQVHGVVKTFKEFDDDIVVKTCLITMYSMCGFPLEARLVFDQLQSKNLVQWNSMLSGYTRNEHWEDALALFVELLTVTKLKPDNFTLPCVIKACSGLLDVEWGLGVHGMAVKIGLDANVYVGNSLIAMYGKCEFVECAIQLFEQMPDRNLVSWNSMLLGFSENGLSQQTYAVFMEMLLTADGFAPDVATMVTVLPVCADEGDIEMGKMLHCLCIKLGLSEELKVNNALIDMYCKCGYLSRAECLFHRLENKNVVTWNSMLNGYSSEGDISKTIGLLRELQLEQKQIKVNEVTMLNVLPVFSDYSELLILKELHGFAFRHGFQSDEMVANALIVSYAKCGSMDSAEFVFYDTEGKKISSWNALLNGYAENGEPMEALKSFRQMTTSGLDPDYFTVSSVLVACADIKSLCCGKQIHGYLLRKGLELDPFITIPLLSFYIQCKKLLGACILFDRMEHKTLVHWNAMLSACSQNGYPDEVLTLFRQMLSHGVEPHFIAILSALGACSQLSALRLGQELHCYAIKSFLLQDIYVGCSVTNMYAKSGSIEHALRVFNLLERHVAAYNVIIAACGIHGHGREAIELFTEMQGLCKKPDGFTFIGILMACSHAGMVDEGVKYFEQMQTLHGLEPQLGHYACVVDMLGRAGRLYEALKLVEDMPHEPDIGIWNSLLSSARVHGSLDMGEVVAKKLLELEPNKAESYVLLSNLYAKLGKWDDVRTVRQLMKESGLQKEAGCSWIEVGGKVYSFVVGDQLLPENKKIGEMWSNMEEKIREVGYEPDLDSVLHELGAEEKIEILQGHSEKLAISFGLLKTKGGRTLRVYKNLRICVDCHNAAKAISKVSGREIIVRDNKRFHHFRAGSCSCGDYW